MRPAMLLLWIVGAALLPMALAGQENAVVSVGKDLIRVDSPVAALEHVRVIDGTGAAAKPDQTIVISAGKIAVIGDSDSVKVPENAKRIDFAGHTALPGLVGMHDHLFYVTTEVNDNFVVHDMPYSFPRLFLANGVTTIRTTGSYEPYTDLEIKQAIDQGKMIGPKINVTGPYLVDGKFEQIQLHKPNGPEQIQVHKLSGPEDAVRTVNYWSDEGMTSFKAYEYISRAELKAAIEATHKRGLTIAGHLCSIGFREAAEMGIDSLEHGLFVDTEFDPAKRPDVCPEDDWPAKVDPEVDSEQIRQTINSLMKHHVAVTSTLPIIEKSLSPPPDVRQVILDSLGADALKSSQEFRLRKSREANDERKREESRRFAEAYHKEMQFEVAFVRAGGLLMAGSDAVLFDVIAGFADQRELELLVEAGFTPLEAIKIATLNGAQFLKQADRIGSLAVGKQADIVLVKGDPSTNIRDIENVDLVFKDGMGYDSRKLIESVKGLVGIR
jgi:imidazolonepropionase-like amidohydrolase